MARNCPGRSETSQVWKLHPFLPSVSFNLPPVDISVDSFIWTSGAFAALDEIYGSTTEPSALKKDFLLPSNIVSNSDITRLVNSPEVQSVLREPRGYASTKRTGVQKKNPLRNRQVLLRLNPYASAFSKDKLGQVGNGKDSKGKPERAGETFTKILHEN